MRKYNSTYFACFVGIITQAIITNITAILFVPFMNLYGLQFWHLGLLIAINFGAQMVADIVLTFIIDKISFRPPILIAAALAMIGLCLFGLAPFIFDNVFTGIILATCVFAFSSGMVEVLISPIIDNTPSGKGKGTVMSLMHSFYAWGQVLVIVVTTLYLFIFGFENWFYLMFVWAVFPVIYFIFFSFAPLDKKEVKKGSAKKTFTPFLIVAIIAIMMGGSTEIIMNQWTSTFLDISGLSKMTADLVGMGMYAVMMGIGRVLYGKLGNKFNLSKILTLGAFFSFILYILAGVMPLPQLSLICCVLCGFTSSLLWPGTLVIASEKFPTTGVWLFAVLAMSGDIGGSATPLLMGFLAEKLDMSLAFIIMSVVPFICFLCHLYIFKSSKSKDNKMLNGEELNVGNNDEVLHIGVEGVPVKRIDNKTEN